MNKRNKPKSIRSRLFITLILVVLIMIAFLVLVNNVVLERFYLYSKQETLLSEYRNINYYYNNIDKVDIGLELEKIALKNNFDIVIRSEQDISVYSSNKDFLTAWGKIIETKIQQNDKNLLYSDKNTSILRVTDEKTGLNFIFLEGQLDNGYQLYIRIPISSIQESVKISNTFLYFIGGLSILIGGVVMLVISKRFTQPILELNDIAKKMSNLDFSTKYRTNDIDDEINNLGKSINMMSTQLEKTINKLTETNIELEKDIEEKSKIDEMRKQFISDVSHELKTPITLIQGYAEGLVENVSADEESRKFYAEVILDEANKMDLLVKQLLELMKLEYGKREFNNCEFNLVELVKEVIRKTDVMIKEQNINVTIDSPDEVLVNADEFYIEQVITNYVTNAVKYSTEINGKKEIKIKIESKDDKVRFNIYNTGSKINQEDMQRIWNRFYKVDNSRNRENGGTGIGLSLVKAIMNNYENKYGVENKQDGVEFYFELDKVKEDKSDKRGTE